MRTEHNKVSTRQVTTYTTGIFNTRHTGGGSVKEGGQAPVQKGMTTSSLLQPLWVGMAVKQQPSPTVALLCPSISTATINIIHPH